MSLKKKDQKKQVVDKESLETLSDKDLQMIVGGSKLFPSINYMCFNPPKE